MPRAATLAWLTEQMADLKTKVQDSSTALQNYRVKSGILGLQEQRQITAQKIMDFNKAYLEAQAQRLSVEAKMNELARIAADRGGIQTIFTVADNTLIQKLKQEAAELDVQKSKLLKTYKDKQLVYAATARCPCGAGLAHPKKCGQQGSWDCSATARPSRRDVDWSRSTTSRAAPRSEGWLSSWG